MKKLLFIGMLFLQINFAFSQLNMSLLGNLQYSGRGDVSDIWGYVDELNNEYAIVGLESGVSIVDVTNASSPNEVFWTTGANTIWRDMKTWNDKAYITNEGGNGLMIIDMAPLPGSTSLSVTNYTGSTYPFQSAHNLYIDENGYCYIFGSNYEVIPNVGVTIILNLNLPTSDPNFEVGIYSDYYFHDGMVRGDTLWGGAINDGFLAAIDVSNKSNPTLMGTKNTPSNFTHNAWISDNGQYVFTTDEKSNAYLGAYDVSDLGNITETDRVQSSPGQNVIPHNVHVIGDFIVTSYYRDGVTIHDICDPYNIVEVGNYDTSPSFTGNGFNGCWGVYPWLPSGNIIASDIENGLFVLSANYVSSAKINGNVTDSVTTAALDGVQVDILTTPNSTNTNVIGDYQFGIATPGFYDLSFSKAGYATKVISNVDLTSTGCTPSTLNVELKPLVPFNFSGQVIEAGTSNPISNAKVRISNAQLSTTVTTNGSGNFTVNNFTEGTYTVTAGKWSYITSCTFNQTIDDNTSNYTIVLDKGYYDDFSLEFNWVVTGNATAGVWERDVPIGTEYNGDDVNPGVDVLNDCLEEAYVTGNGGGGAGDDDIDDGATILTSPVFDATLYFDPYVEYYRWFYNDGGFNTPNDQVEVKLNNGSTEVVIDMADANSPTNSTWVSQSLRIADFITPTNTMTFIVETGDLGSGHLVEAGLDKFQVIDGAVGINETMANTDFNIYPNPFNTEINIQIKNATDIEVNVTDVTGKMLDHYTFKNQSLIQLTNNYDKGVYFVNVFANGELVKTQKLVKF